MPRSLCALVVSLALLLGHHSAIGDAGTATLTVGAVRQALIDAIGRLDSVLQDASQNVKAVGNSLEANARGVVSDIDHRLGDKLGYTFDRLDDSEKRFLSDAQALVARIDTSARDIIGQTESAARRVLGDTDIVAYGTLYSLPCRDQIPRVVYATPEVFYESFSVPEIALRGNFLDVGSEPAITVNGRPARLVARSANQMRVVIPPSVARDVATPHSVAVRFRPTARYRSCLVFGLIPWSRERPLPSDLSASILLQPKTTVSIVATLTPVLAQRQTGTWSFGDSRGTDNDCDRHFDATLTFCIPDAWGGRLTATAPFSGPSINSKNCNSDVEGVDVIGDRCIRVRAHIGGCGYDNFFLAKNCKGNGWLNYGIVLNGERFVPVNGPDFVQTLQGVVPVQDNFLFRYNGDLGGQTPSGWHYRATLHFYRGDLKKPIRTVEVSDTAAFAGGVASRLDNAILAIDMSQVVTGLFSAAQ